MERWIQIFAYALAAMALASALWAAFRQLCPPDQTRCPGPPRPWRVRLLPWRWLDRACGYSILGLPVSAGRVRCPECGSLTSERDRTKRSASPSRLLVAACVLGIASGVCWKARWIAKGGWARYVPTPLLTTTVRVLPSHTPPGIRSELTRRLEGAELSETQRDRLIAAAIANLGSDDADWNAAWAMSTLASLREQAVPALRKALRSPDWQRRQLAAHLLRERELFEPSDDLLRVTVEGLRDDDTPYRRKGWRLHLYCPNAQDGLRFLSRFPDRVTPFLIPGLSSDDNQQRLLCAVVAGFTSRTELIDLAAPILIEHLRDNIAGDDARVAIPALYRFGPGILPLLLAACKSDDRQQREAANYLVSCLRPGSSGIQATDARRAPPVDGRTHDPAKVQLDDLYDLSFDGLRDLAVTR